MGGDQCSYRPDRDISRYLYEAMPARVTINDVTTEEAHTTHSVFQQLPLARVLVTS